MKTMFLMTPYVALVLGVAMMGHQTITKVVVRQRDGLGSWLRVSRVSVA